MPLFFFDVWDGKDMRCDPRGISLHSLSEAISDALDVVRKSELAGTDLANHVVYVRDATGRTVVLPLSHPPAAMSPEQTRAEATLA